MVFSKPFLCVVPIRGCWLTKYSLKDTISV